MTTKITDSAHSTIVWGSLATEPPRISACTLYRMNAESLLLLSVCVLSFLNVHRKIQNTHHLCSKVR